MRSDSPRDHALRVLADAVRESIRQREPEQQPEEEDYDDTESAYNNGHDVARWEMCQELRAALKRAGLEAE